MRDLLLLPVRLPFRIARGGLGLVTGAVGQAVRHAGGSQAPEAPSPVASRAAPAPPPAPAPPAPAPPAAPSRPLAPAPPPSAPRPAARRVPARVQEPPRVGGPDSPPTPPEAIPPEPTPGQAAAERTARREAEQTPDSPGPEIRIDEPWPGYRKQAAAAIVTRLGDADDATKAVVRLYESSHRKRKSVLAATD